MNAIIILFIYYAVLGNFHVGTTFSGKDWQSIFHV